MKLQADKSNYLFSGIWAALSVCCLVLALVCSFNVNAAPGDQLWPPVAVGGNIGSSVAIDQTSGNLYLGSADQSVRA